MVIASSKYELKVTFVEPVLGSQPGKDTVASDFLKQKAIEDNPKLTPEMITEEYDTLPEVLQKGTTVFHRDAEGRPLFYNYVVKGVLKSSAMTLNGLKTGKTKIDKSGNEKVDAVVNFRSCVDTTVAVNPRRIIIHTDKPIGILERPIRIMTQQGPRVALARSEMIEAGAFFTCEIICYEVPKFTLTEELLRILLDYSRDIKGFGQWHNSGIYGKFDYTLTKM